MKLSPLGRVAVAGGFALAFPTVVLAHATDLAPTSWSCGFAHPLHAWDHCLAATAIGLWAALHRPRDASILGASFLAAVACGAALGTLGTLPAGIDLLVLLSVIFVGAVLASGAGLRVRTSALLVGSFGLCHGLAHAAEAPALAGTLPYVAGLVTATGGLLAAGLGAGSALLRFSPSLVRLAGVACATAGVGLLWS